jgi:hypothetical protein
MFSGQSEEGHELFTLADGLKRVAGLSYQYGEGASFCFSPDETILVMALPFTCSEWWYPWDDGEAEPDGFGRLSIGFGQLWVHEITTGKISVHELRVSASEDCKLEHLDYDPDLKPQFLSQKELELSMPWKVFVIPIPIQDVVVFSL